MISKTLTWFCAKVCLEIWPAATNVVALHPHQTKRVSTAIPSWIALPPQTKNAEKRMFSMGIDPALNRVCSPLRPLSKSPNASDGPSLAQRKLAWHPCQAHGLFSMTSIQNGHPGFSYGIVKNEVKSKKRKYHLHKSLRQAIG